MNSRTKRRLGLVTGIVVIVLIAVLAVVGGNSAAKSVTVAEALELQGDAKIQVTGNVVENSFAINDNVLTFQIYDPDADPAVASPLDVRYDGGVSATFGNDVTAICTGKKGADGVLLCSELVTKCPSKYENADGALSVADLIGYGETVVGKPVKVSGTVLPGSIADVGADERFVIEDGDSDLQLHVKYDGALPEGTADGSKLVITGSLGTDNRFAATDVALEG